MRLYLCPVILELIDQLRFASTTSTMSTLKTIMLFSSLVTIVPIACAAAPASSPSELQSILANPQAYDGKRVTVTGLAEIGGAEFSLYPDERSQRPVGKAAFICLDSNGRSEEHTSELQSRFGT